jgi:hypothetical protein
VFSARRRIYHGTWGAALFQSMYQPAVPTLISLTLMPEWYLVIAALAGLSVLGLSWTPMLAALPLLGAAIAIPVGHAGRSAARASFSTAGMSRILALELRVLTAILHLLQPLARLDGRLRHGLTPWRSLAGRTGMLPGVRTARVWSERWQSSTARLESLEAVLQGSGAAVRRGGSYDRWDLEVPGGLVGSARARMVIEEHGEGKQLIRVKSWPRFATAWCVLAILMAVLSVGAAVDHAWTAFAALGATSILLVLAAAREASTALRIIVAAVQGQSMAGDWPSSPSGSSP